MPAYPAQPSLALQPRDFDRLLARAVINPDVPAPAPAVAVPIQASAPTLRLITRVEVVTPASTDWSTPLPVWQRAQAMLGSQQVR